MKPSSERLQKQAVSRDDEPCNERKCANCFEHRGCIYDRYMCSEHGKTRVATIPANSDTSFTHSLPPKTPAVTILTICSDRYH